MRRVNVFLIILIASLASLIAVTVIGVAIFTSAQTSASQYPSNWMGDMWGQMGGMMGGTTPTSSIQSPLLPYFGVVFVVLIGVTIVGVGGLAYYVAFPEIRNSVAIETAEPVLQICVAQKPLSNGAAYESVVKTLTDEERKVVEVLAVHDGKYLQKYIRKEAELSRLKTHRIVARLAERGIVTLEKTGNTNQVFLANWLKQTQ
jgi:uncharacterized membrane protein